jgi:hypothetical protein
VLSLHSNVPISVWRLSMPTNVRKAVEGPQQPVPCCYSFNCHHCCMVQGVVCTSIYCFCQHSACTAQQTTAWARLELQYKQEARNPVVPQGSWDVSYSCKKPRCQWLLRL